MQSQLLRAWKLGLTTSHGPQVLSSKYEMNAYMATLLEVRLGTCDESRLKQKAKPNSQTQVLQLFCIQ
jgi:hypothetical protein